MSADVEPYTLPTASSSTLGGVKIGTGLSVNSSGVLTADVQDIPIATTSSAGIVQVGNGLSINGGILSADVQDIPIATTSTVGVVKPQATTFKVEADGTLKPKYMYNFNTQAQYFELYSGTVSTSTNLQVDAVAGEILNINFTAVECGACFIAPASGVVYRWGYLYNSSNAFRFTCTGYGTYVIFNFSARPSSGTCVISTYTRPNMGTGG